MIAPVNATASSPASQHALLSLKDASAYVGLDPQALRRMANAGLVRCHTLPSGHRRFSSWELDRVLKVSDPVVPTNADTDADTVPILLVGRVSSHAQAATRGSSDQSDLERQVERLRSYIAERWGDKADVTENVRVASGCNFQHDKLHDLFRLIWSGRYKYLVATYFDRVLRIGWELVELACREFGVEVIYIATESEDSDPQKEMVTELLSILTLYTARASGNKSRETNKYMLDVETEREVWVAHCQGYSYASIETRLKEAGKVDQKGRNYTKASLLNHIRDNRKKLETLYGTDFPSSFKQFWLASVREKEGAKLGRQQLLVAYTDYCSRNGIERLTDHKIGIELRKLGVMENRAYHSEMSWPNLTLA